MLQTLSDQERWHVSLTLPLEFPHCLPVVMLERRPGSNVVPHLEANGKICIAPDTNVLIDTDRPERVVEDVLARAQSTVEAWMSAGSAGLATEFDAYWRQDATPVLSLCDSEGPSGVIYVGTADLQHLKGVPLVADSSDKAHAWSRKLGVRLVERGTGFRLRLSRPPRAIPAESHPHAGPWLDDALSAADQLGRAGLNQWQRSIHLPVILLFSFPVPSSPLRGVCAIEFLASERLRKDALRGGFRQHTVTPLRQLAAARRDRVHKRAVTRLDEAYLVRRASASQLGSRRVLVVGCGAVGATLASKLAVAGVGELGLVDREDLMPENCHRHELGIDAVFSKKATTLATRLQQRFPHLTVKAYPNRIEDVITSDPCTVAGADCLVFATGDETLERRFNRLLAPRQNRVHVWVEPLGVGAHVLVAPGTGSGCYECLFSRTEQGLLVNMAAFSAPGQEFLTRIGGCAAAYSPFSYLDSDRAAALAASDIIALLSRGTPGATLTSWRGNEQLFLSAGFTLSHRGATSEGERLYRQNVTRRDCPVCLEAAEQA